MKTEEEIRTEIQERIQEGAKERFIDYLDMMVETSKDPVDKAWYVAIVERVRNDQHLSSMDKTFIGL